MTKKLDAASSGAPYIACLAGGVFNLSPGGRGALVPLDDGADFIKGARYIPGEVTDARRQGLRVVFDPDEHRWTLPNGEMVPLVSQYRTGGVVFPAEYCAESSDGTVTRAPCLLNVTTGELAQVTASGRAGRQYVVYAGQEFELAPSTQGAQAVSDYRRLMKVAQMALMAA